MLSPRSSLCNASNSCSQQRLITKGIWNQRPAATWFIKRAQGHIHADPASKTLDTGVIAWQCYDAIEGTTTSREQSPVVDLWSKMRQSQGSKKISSSAKNEI